MDQSKTLHTKGPDRDLGKHVHKEWDNDGSEGRKADNLLCGHEPISIVSVSIKIII